MSNFPAPANAVAVTTDDIYTAVYNYIKAYARPAYSDENIIRGWQNGVSLPNIDDFAIMQILGHYRQGTNVESFDATGKTIQQDGTLLAAELVLADVQIDCYGDIKTGYAARRAQALETAAKSYLGCRFFQDYNIGCQYATGPKQIVTELARGYVDRWSVTLRLSFVSQISVEVPWFSALNVSIKNVDVTYQP